VGPDTLRLNVDATFSMKEVAVLDFGPDSARISLIETLGNWTASGRILTLEEVEGERYEFAIELDRTLIGQGAVGPARIWTRF
jgi:hypothetical protein